jgi:hypothetical protein
LTVVVVAANETTPIHSQANLVPNKQYSVFQLEATNTHKTKQHQHKLGFRLSLWSS